MKERGNPVPFHELQTAIAGQDAIIESGKIGTFGPVYYDNLAVGTIGTGPDNLRPAGFSPDKLSATWGVVKSSSSLAFRFQNTGRYYLMDTDAGDPRGATTNITWWMNDNGAWLSVKCLSICEFVTTVVIQAVQISNMRLASHFVVGILEACDIRRNQYPGD